MDETILEFGVDSIKNRMIIFTQVNGFRSTTKKVHKFKLLDLETQ